MVALRLAERREVGVEVAAAGEETRDSRPMHSAMRACMPAERPVARATKKDQCPGPQKGSLSRAERRAGSMCGKGGSWRFAACVETSVSTSLLGSSEVGVVTGEEFVEAAGEELGEEIEAVDRRDAAMVRRMCDSVLRAPVVTHA